MSTDPGAPSADLAAWVARMLPALVLAMPMVAAWPGYLSFDSAAAFAEARSQRFADVAPPLLPWLWSVLLTVLPATMGPLLLIWVTWSVGLALLIDQAIRLRANRLGWALAALAPLFPIGLMLLPHLWNDVLLAGLLLLAVGLIVRGGGLIMTGLLLMVLLAATALRHNAMLAVLPLVGFWLIARFGCSMRTHLLAGGLLAVTIALVVAATFINASLAERKIDTWAVTLMFDLQAVSVARGEIMLPAELIGAGMTVEQLETAFHPYSSTTLFTGTRSGVANPTIERLDADQRRALLRAWWSLPFTRDYWHHRVRLMAGMLGRHDRPGLRGLADSPGLVQVADNPALERRFERPHGYYRMAVNALKTTFLVAPGWYLFAALVLVPLLAHRRARPWMPAAWALWVSALAYTASFAAMAPSAELRYLLWSSLASWLAVLIVVFAPSDRQAVIDNQRP